jgi:hypothetical protein
VQLGHHLLNPWNDLEGFLSCRQPFHQLVTRTCQVIVKSKTIGYSDDEIPGAFDEHHKSSGGNLAVEPGK